MRIVGGLIALVFLFLGIMNGGALSIVIDIPSVLMVCGLTLGISWQGGVPVGLVTRSFWGSNPNAEDLQMAIVGMKQVRDYMVAAGVISTLIGLLILCHLLDDYSALLPGLATALIPLFYAVVLSYAFFLPLQHRLEARLKRD